MANEDGVPPLEDMSAVLDSLKVSSTSKYNIDMKRGNTSTEHNITEEKPSTDSSFAGFKKGFMFSPSSAQKSQQTTGEKLRKKDEIIYVQRRPEEETNAYKFDDVQEAMKSSEHLLKNKAWVTDDLLQKVSGNPGLIQKLQDPKFMAILTEFQSNPPGAMAKYSSDKEVQKFFMEFCGIMGDHFTGLGDSPSSHPNEPEVQVREPGGADMGVVSSTNPKQPTSADEAKMQDILQDLHVRDVLGDKRIQKLIESLRKDPVKAQDALNKMDDDLRQKVQVLVKAGLLQFESR